MLPTVRLAPALVVWAAATAVADYPLPEAAGFHHCALVYDRPERPAADLLPYVAHVRDDRPRAWLFDALAGDA